MNVIKSWENIFRINSYVSLDVVKSQPSFITKKYQVMQSLSIYGYFESRKWKWTDFFDLYKEYKILQLVSEWIYNESLFVFLLLKGIIKKTERALINDRLSVSKLSWKFYIPTIYNFAVIYPWNFPQRYHFLPPDTHTYVCVLGGKKW